MLETARAGSRDGMTQLPPPRAVEKAARQQKLPAFCYLEQARSGAVGTGREKYGVRELSLPMQCDPFCTTSTKYERKKYCTRTLKLSVKRQTYIDAKKSDKGANKRK